MPHVYEWEYQGKIANGTYHRIISHIRQGLMDLPKYSHPQTTRLVAHFRRGDLAEKSSGHGNLSLDGTIFSWIKTF